MESKEDMGISDERKRVLEGKVSAGDGRGKSDGIYVRGGERGNHEAVAAGKGDLERIREELKRECFRCGHKWVISVVVKAEEPKQCPRCKSPYWNRKRKVQKRGKVSNNALLSTGVESSSRGRTSSKADGPPGSSAPSSTQSKIGRRNGDMQNMHTTREREYEPAED